jgi:DNA replication protein DnaC
VNLSNFHLFCANAPSQSCILDRLDAQEHAEARRQFLSQILSTHVAANTAYNEQGKYPCDSDTRVDILADIKKWVYDISDNSQSFLWLTGDPGSGKSAITASVAQECKEDQILWAQFFINRNLGSTTNPAFYFPSMPASSLIIPLTSLSPFMML